MQAVAALRGGGGGVPSASSMSGTERYGATGPRPITEDERPQPSKWGMLPRASLQSPRWIRHCRTADRHSVSRMGVRQRVVVSGTRHRAGHGRPPRAAFREDRPGGVAHSHPRQCPGAGASRRAWRSRRPVLSREYRTDPDGRVRETFARLANRPLRLWHVPAAASRFAVGPLLADSLKADAVFSNVRLLAGLGFHFRVSHARTGTRASPRSAP